MVWGARNGLEVMKKIFHPGQIPNAMVWGFSSTTLSNQKEKAADLRQQGQQGQSS
jgi:hypothetical protein